MDLTPEQKAALDDLNEQMRVFVVDYCGPAMGNATKAATTAKYRKPAQQGCRLLKHAKVQAAIAQMRATSSSRDIATIEELREMWTRIARGEVDDVVMTKVGPRKAEPSLSVRMKATELLGKSQGVFLDRKALEGGAPGTPPVQVTLTLDEAKRIARGGRR